MNQFDAQAIIEEAMMKHGLYAMGWRFAWDKAKLRFGSCSYRRKTVSMSVPLTLLNSEDDVRDTILHEIAHALAGPDTNHGLMWQHKARMVGARPERCCDKSVVMPPAKYLGKCVDCGVEMKYYRLSRLVRSTTAFHTKCRRRGKSGKVTWNLVAGNKLIPMRVVEMERQ